MIDASSVADNTIGSVADNGSTIGSVACVSSVPDIDSTADNGRVLMILLVSLTLPW